MTAPAVAATASASGTAASPTSAATASGTAAPTSISTPLGTTITASFRPAFCRTRSGQRCIPIEVGLVIGKIAAAFDGQRGSASRFAALSTASAIMGKLAAHFCALFLEDGFARQPDPVALDGQHFHQYLVAFLQFVADVRNAVFRNFADVQQPVGAGNDLDEGAEIRQPGHSAEIGLSNLSRRRQVADDL